MGKRPTPAEIAAEKRQGKRVATSSATQTKRKGTKKPAAKARAPTQDDLFNKFMSMPFKHPKFVDMEVLEKLGIQEDVMIIFNNIGVQQFMTTKLAANQGLTCEFLATLSVRVFEPTNPTVQQEYEEYGRGLLTFSIKGKMFRVSNAEICEIFGFPDEATSNDHRFRYPMGEHVRLWRTIGSGKFEPGVTRAALIRNPAIRYAYKALMHVFYCKVECDTVTLEGLELLGIGLKPLLPTLRDGGEFDGPDRIPCLATLLLRGLTDYKEWAWETSNKRMYMGIGWIATAILSKKVKSIQLSPCDFPTMDEPYLNKARFIKRTANGFSYSFHPSPSSTAKILLPAPALTRLDSLDNVIFNPPSEYHEVPVQEEYPEPTYGIARYNFEPYTGPMNTTAACSNAHERINLLQKTVKWQQRQMNKMAKTIKSLKKTIKDFTCMRSEGSEPTRMEMSGEESSHRAQRKGKGKRRAPTPSPSTSNESIDLETESSTPPSPTHSQ